MSKQKVLVTDSRLLENKLIEPVLQGCDTILYKQWKGIASAESISFTCPTPTDNVEIDRCLNLVVPVRLTFSMADVPAGTYLINPDLSNLRSFPIHKALSQIRLTLNNNTFTMGIGEIMSALEHYATNASLKNLEYSKCSTYGSGQVQQFNAIPNGQRSELALYASSISGLAPQMYPFTVVSQTTPVGPGTGTASAVVEFVSTEALMISPCYFGIADDNVAAFVGIRTIDLQLDFQPNAGFRMFAIDNADATIPLGSGAITVVQKYSFAPSDNFTYEDKEPKLLVQYLQAQVQHKKNLAFEYPYYQIANYSTPHSASLATLTSAVVSSGEVTLPRLPSKLFIFARKPNSTFTTTPFTPDAFMAITGLSIRWNNRICLHGAHQTQLYDMSIRNGVNLDYASWSGLGIATGFPAAAANGFGSVSKQFYGTGTIICLDPLIDLGLTNDMSQYPQRQISLQVDATVKNIAEATFIPQLYVLALTDGVMRIADGVVTTHLGVADTKLNTPIYDKDPTNLEPLVAQRKMGSLSLHSFSLKNLFRRGNQRETQTNRGI